MDEIEKKIKFNKKPKKNKKNNDQIKKIYMINWDWMMKLKAKKISTKISRIKNLNQKNKN